MVEKQTTVAEEQQTPTQSETTSSESINFIDTLPEDIRSEASLANIKDVNQLAKGYVHAQRMVGADKIGLPNQHSTDNDWSEIYNKLGRPEAADQYEISYATESESVESLLPGYKEVAHAAGLNNAQAQKLMDWYSNMEQETITSGAAAEENLRSAAEVGLRKEYGLAYDKNLQSANQVFQKYFGEEFATVKLNDGSLVGDNPQFIKSLVELSKNFAEDSFEEVQTANAMTPGDAQKEINTLTAPNSPYWDKQHPQHQNAVDEVFQLRQMAHPDLVE